MEFKTVSIVGLGALGISFGNQLAMHLPAGQLRIVADSKRVQKYRQSGVYCNNARCSFDYYTAEEIPPADLLIFSVKFGALADAIKQAAPQVGANTIIISLLNGISSEDMIGDAFGHNRVIYCVAQGMDSTRVDNRVVYKNLGKLCLGEKNNEKTERLNALIAFLNKNCVPAEPSDNILHKQWSKFMVNVGLNQCAMVFKTGYGGLQIPGKPRETMIAAMREVLAISQAANIHLTEDEIDYWLAAIDALGPDGSPSMRQDALAQRYSEVEMFSGAILQLGKQYNIKTPVNQMLYTTIKEIESSY